MGAGRLKARFERRYGEASKEPIPKPGQDQQKGQRQSFDIKATEEQGLTHPCTSRR